MKKDIRNLLLVLGVSLAAAVGTTSWFLYVYSPSGRYLAENTLIKPDELPRLNYNDTNPRTNQPDRYQFDKIVYSFWDKSKQKEGILEIDILTYRKFYEMVLKDDSLMNPPAEIESLFRKSPPAKLEVKVKSESQEAPYKDSKDLIKVEFAEGSDYFRVRLDEDDQGVNWVYYYHDNIYKKTYKLFIP